MPTATSWSFTRLSPRRNRALLTCSWSARRPRRCVAAAAGLKASTSSCALPSTRSSIPSFRRSLLRPTSSSCKARLPPSCASRDRATFKDRKSASSDKRRPTMKTLGWSAALFALIATSSAVCLAEGLQGEVDQATTVIEKFKDMPEDGIPKAVLHDAKGLAILTVLKAGFVFSGQGGWGIVVARTAHGWSGPSAIGTGGVGFGFQVGAEVTEFILVLNTPAAVSAFEHGANVKIGGDLSAAAGPVGRDVAAGVMPVAAVYTYSRSQGLFAGVSLEGTVIAERSGANVKYYGRH